MKKLTFAITGANGQLGSFLVKYLRSRDYIVYELVRSPEKAEDKKYYKFFDLAQPDNIPSLQGVDVLIHTAYFFDTTVKQYKTININGTVKLFQKAHDDQVQHNIFISTLSAHENARSLYGRTKYELEKLLINQHDNINIIRPGLIFHTPLQGITAAMDNFVKKFPVVPLIGLGKQRIYPCLLKELAQLILTLSTNQPKISRPIIAASEQAITFKQLVNYLAKQRQKKIISFPVPFYAIHFMLKMTEFLRLPLNLRSDSLIGLHYCNDHIDFSETKKLDTCFSALNI